jgi:Fe-S-cluster containining protein
MKIKISAAMARQPFHGCEPDYIKEVCKGACCRHSTRGAVVHVLPNERDSIIDRGGEITADGLLRPVDNQCPFQTQNNLCGIHEQKPFGCRVSPFTLNKNNTLIVRNRYRLLKCYRDGDLPAYKAFRDSLTELFGEEKTSYIENHLDNGGGDLMVEIDADKVAAMNAKNVASKSNGEARGLVAAELKVETALINTVIPYARNPRRNDAAISKVAASLQEFGWRQPIVVDDDMVVVAGHTRLEAARSLGMGEVPIHIATGLTPEQIKAYRLADNRVGQEAEWDEELLRLELGELEAASFSLDLTGFDTDEWQGLLLDDAGLDSDNEEQKAKLSEKFMVAPFSVLNAREGWWQARKGAWIGLGIQSELGRGENGYDAFPGGSKMVSGYTPDGKRLAEGIRKNKMALGSLAPHWQRGGKGGATGTSVFDPVLCELVYRWFSPPGGIVLDPFAGGSVRGVVASVLGRQYVGYDLRPEQVAANDRQAAAICDGHKPSWVVADSRTIDQADTEADFLFSCPPYADLEVYSDDSLDLSTLPYAEFRDSYREIIAKSCAKLKDDRFACFVVGEVRDKKGKYYNFIGDTISAFLDAGVSYYNEMILVTAIGSLPIRVGRQFSVSRKIGKTHQNVLVFVKGDPSAAVARAGEVLFDDDLFVD